MKKSNAIRTTFKAYERLKREQHVDTLFRTGKAFSVSPIKFLYLEIGREEHELSPIRVGFSVPKKKFRKAVVRNKLKRVLRESWRLHKSKLYEQIEHDRQLHLFLIYLGPEIPDFQTINNAIGTGILKLLKRREAHA